MQKPELKRHRRHLIEIAAMLTVIEVAFEADADTEAKAKVAEQLEAAADAVGNAVCGISDILGVPHDAVC